MSLVSQQYRVSVFTSRPGSTSSTHFPYRVRCTRRVIRVSDDRAGPQVLIGRHGRDSGPPRPGGNGGPARGCLVGDRRGFYPLSGSSRGPVSTHLANGIRSACRAIGIGDDRASPQVLIGRHGRDRGFPRPGRDGSPVRGCLIGDRRGRYSPARVSLVSLRPVSTHLPDRIRRACRVIGVSDDRAGPQVLIGRHGRNRGSPCPGGNGGPARGRLVGDRRGFYPLPSSSRGPVSSHLTDRIRSACRAIGVGDDHASPQVLIGRHGRDSGFPRPGRDGGPVRGCLIGDRCGRYSPARVSLVSLRPVGTHLPDRIRRACRVIGVSDDRAGPQVLIGRHGRNRGSPCPGGNGGPARGCLVGDHRGFYPFPGSSRGPVSTHLTDGIRCACRAIGVGDDRAGPQVLIGRYGRDRGFPRPRRDRGPVRGCLIGHCRG